MQTNHIVIDQNMLRDQAAIERVQQGAIRRSGPRILLPDPVLLEMTKGAEWLQVVSRSLELLSTHPEVVDCAYSVSELMRYEHRTGNEIPTVVDLSLSAAFQQVLRDAPSRSGDAWDSFVTRTAAAREAARSTHLDAEAHRTRTIGFVGAMQGMLSNDAIKELRRNPHDDALRLWILTDARITTLMAATLAAKGFPNSEQLALGYSLSARALLSNLATALDWIA